MNKERTEINNWPDSARLKMIEKSELYSDPKIYQFGFYDGFQFAQPAALPSPEEEALEVAHWVQENNYYYDSDMNIWCKRYCESAKYLSSEKRAEYYKNKTPKELYNKFKEERNQQTK